MPGVAPESGEASVLVWAGELSTAGSVIVDVEASIREEVCVSIREGAGDFTACSSDSSRSWNEKKRAAATNAKPPKTRAMMVEGVEGRYEGFIPKNALNCSKPK